MSYKAKYGALLDDIANEADRMAMSYFRGGAMGAERKRDGTVVTQADKRIEQMAIAKGEVERIAYGCGRRRDQRRSPEGPRNQWTRANDYRSH